MKRIFLMISLIATMLFSWSCSDYLNVNHNPDALEEIPDAKVLLPVAQIAIANNLMGWDFGFAGAFWVEYWTQTYTASQFKVLCEYQSQYFATSYTSLYGSALNNLKKIKEITAEDDNKAYYFIAEALSIFTWQIITDVWGNVPYSEALQGSDLVLHPKFDKGEDIYTDLLKRVNELLTIDLGESVIFSSDAQYDMIYAGDLDAWYQFANALKLKLMLRLSETSVYNNAEVLSFVDNNDLLTESAKIPRTTWSDGQSGKRHPMRAFQAGGANYISTNVIGCKTFIDYLYENEDPRLDKLFTYSGYDHLGAFFGDFDSTEDSDEDEERTLDKDEIYSRSSFQATAAPAIYMDLMVMSDWEVNFYIAEVYARANQPDKAQEYYENGVLASLTQQEIDDDAIIQAGGYAEWKAGTVEAQIKQIAMQKWVANCNYQHIESFLERNRTKYPAVNEINVAANRREAWNNFPVGDLTISVNGRALLNGTLPASPMYPEAVLSRNNNAPGQKANIGEKVWWNQKAGK